MSNNYVAMYKDGKYVIGTITEERDFCEKDINKLLPGFFKCEICDNKLLDSISNVGYFEYENEYRVYDKNYISYLDLTVPVCIKKYGNLKMTKKKYGIKLPTEEMIKKAKEIFFKIAEEIEKYNYREDIEKLNKYFSNYTSIKYFKEDEFKNIDKAILYTNMIILWTNGTDYVIGCPDNVIDLELVLCIPDEIKGYVLGKKAKNIEIMEEKMRVEKIKLEII